MFFRHFICLSLTFVLHTAVFSQKQSTNIEPFITPYITATTPDWAVMMYGENPNVLEVDRLYMAYYKTHEFEKNTDTRNYKHWRRKIELFGMLQEDGTLLEPEMGTFDKLTEEWMQKKAAFDQMGGVKSANSQWQQIGPFETVQSSATTYRNQQSCQVRFTQCLSNLNVLYTVSQNGKVFKTTDHGENWVAMAENQYFQGDTWSDQAIAVDPNNSNIVYWANESLYGTSYILKSTDGGANWNIIRQENNMSVNSIVIDSTNSQHILFAGEGGIYYTSNGGTTITNVRPGQAWDLKFKTDNPNVVFAICKNGNKSDFYKSQDGGLTWAASITGWFSDAQSNDGGGRMTVSTGNPNLIYCFIGGRVVGDAASKPIIGVAKSIDAGATWTKPITWNNTKGINGGQGYYDWAIEVSDADDNLLLIATQSFWKTTDGFTTVVDGPGNQHADGQQFHFNGPNDFWVCSDGGMDLYDALLTTRLPKTKGMTGTEFWGFDQGWNEDTYVGSYYHNGASVHNDSYDLGIFRNVAGGEPSTGYINVGDANKVYFNEAGSYIMPETPTGIAKSVVYNKFPNESAWSHKDRSEIVPHPSCYNIHYLGKNNILWKTENGGLTFTALYTFGTSATNLVTGIEISRSNPNIMYVFQRVTGSGKLWKTIDGGVTFVEVVQSSSVSSSSGAFISLHPTDPNTLWIAYESPSTSKKVMKTTDGGATWVNLTTALLNNLEPQDILHIAGTDGGIYLMTPNTVFYRNNTMTEWAAFGSGLPAKTMTAYIKPFYKESKLRMATFARGLWSVDMYEAPSTVIPQATVDKLKSFCSRDTFYFEDYSTVNHTGATWSWSFPGSTYVSNASIRNPKVKYDASGVYEAYMTLNTPLGLFKDTISIEVLSNCAADTFPGTALNTIADGDGFVSSSTPLNNITSFTVTGWWKPNGAQMPYAALFSSGDWCAHCDDVEGLIFDYYGTKLWYRWPGSAGNWASNSGITIPLNEWSYVALTITQNGATMYLNDKKYVHTIALNPGQIENLYIGYGHYSKSFKGEIDEVTVWKRALSENEIRALRHITKEDVIMTDTTLIGYWQFNESVNNMQYDHAGVRHGVLVGTATLTTSSAPIGGGSSQLIVLNPSNYNYEFTTTGTKLVLSNCVAPAGTIVSTRLNVAPNILPSGTSNPQNYWILNYYGASNSFPLVDSVVLTPAQNTYLTNNPTANQTVINSRTENGHLPTWDSKAKGLAINGNTISFDRKTNILNGVQLSISSGGATFNEVDPGRPCDRDSVAGSMLVTTGASGSSATSPTGPQFGANQDFSVSIWFKTTSTVTDGAIFSNADWDSGLNPGWVFAITSGKLWWNVADGVRRSQIKPASPVVNDGKWHIFTATCDRDGLNTIYLDGKFVASTSMIISGTPVGNINNTLKLGIGADDENDYRIAAQIDEACIYNRVLSLNEVRELAHLTRTGGGNTSGLVTYYQFNNVGLTDYDKVGQLNLTINSAATRAVSTAPLGGGSFSRVSVTTSGVKDFAGTGVMLAFPSSGLLPNGDLVVSSINASPDTLPNCAGYASNNKYWIIDNYGTNANFAALDSARFGQMLVPSSATFPKNAYQLRQRINANEHLNNWVTKPNFSIEAVSGNAGNISFGSASSITSGGQFLSTHSLSNQIISGADALCGIGTTVLSVSPSFSAYSWSNGGGAGQSANFTGINAPTFFTVTVTDALGCLGIANKQVLAIPQPEICNGLDDDCDGLFDEGVTITFYADADGDTFGNLSVTTQACTVPSGYSANASDCNDGNAAINPAATEVCNTADDDCDGLNDEGVTITFYADADGDTFGNLTSSTQACTVPSGYSANASDCNDGNAAINPAATEICNTVDDDCDGLIDEGVTITFYADTDGDTYGNLTASTQACTVPSGYSANASDCNDGNAAINPAATEVCNTVDDDCDGLIDEGVTITFYADTDGDTYGNLTSSAQACTVPSGYSANASDCNDGNAAINPAASEVCNTVDDDCDGFIDEGVTITFYADADGDTYGNLNASTQACTVPSGYSANASDCNDGNAAINPAASEVCNTVDDDCDGLFDEGVTITFYADTDGDTYGNLNASTQACTVPSGYSANASDCNDGNAAINPAATEVCNTVDDDCDGLIDEGVTITFYADTDGDTFGNLTASTQACTVPSGYSANASDCNDGNAAINPAAIEVCNTVDDDCDGLTDETGGTNTYYADTDGDSFGNANNTMTACQTPFGFVSNNCDCNDNAASVFPGAIEITNNADEDCNGVMDDVCGQVNSVKVFFTTPTSAAIVFVPKNQVLAYNLQFRVLGATAWSPTQTSTQAAITLSALSAGVTYEYRYRVKCPAGFTAYSAAATFVVPTFTGSCSKPSKGDAYPVSNVTAKFWWNHVPGAIKYRLRYRKLGAPVVWQLKVVTPQANTLRSETNVANLLPSSAYIYQVQTFCTGAPNAWSAYGSLDTVYMPNLVCGGVGSQSLVVQEDTEDNSQSTELSWIIKPNPAENFFNIEIEATNSLPLTIIDAQGRIVQKTEIVNGHFQCETKDWQPGVYFVRILDRTQVLMVRH